MSETLSFIMGVLLAVAGAFLVYALGDLQKLRMCAEEHNVFACEITETVAPVTPNPGDQ